MKNNQYKVSEHYTVANLGDRILAALEKAGKDLKKLAPDDLAPVDEFHIRGRAATEELAKWVRIRPEHKLLDVGCGLGGTSRYLAASSGCSVVGVDLTEEYCRVAEMLSARVGLADRTVFRQGSALALPFGEAQFDIVWTEHVQMNIADKAVFYRELARVLKPGGQFAFHDIFVGAGAAIGGSIHLPVPWATEGAISHLIPVDDLRTLLADSGLEVIRWEDRTEASILFFQSVMKRVRNEGWTPVGLHLLMGDDARTRFANVLRNLEENRIRVVQAVMRRSCRGRDHG
ncbi:MAG: methyltransferase domain-containing protein [Acidobacteria bacterium]|nr:methyltransferase domain-containing protein [Acidobacteriota bacterium]